MQGASEDRSRTMRAVKSRDTTPELAVRRLVHGMGYRYRLYRDNLPGKPDLVFAGRKKVVFVHGCFWHRHNCARGARTPKSNQDYWIPKLDRNRRRDRQVRSQLRRLGWKSLVVWECQTKNPKKLANRIKSFLET